MQLLDAARHSERVPGLSKKAAVGLRTFAALIGELVDIAVNPFGENADSTEFNFDEVDEEKSTDEEAIRGPVETVLRAVLDRTGYYRQYEGLIDEDEIQRKSNVDELVSSAALFDRQTAEQEQVATLGGFLETASLAQDVDSLEDESGAVTLMTLHAAKGLEFPDVYLVGVEQNLIPHERSLRENDGQALEEERRLLFVGITRAKDRLVLTYTQRREMHGRSLSTITSDFLQEMTIQRRVANTQISSSGSERELETSPFHDHDFHDHDEVSNRHEAGRVASYDQKIARKPKKKPIGKMHLTTGAALESGSNITAAVPIGFALGMQVRHPRYGLGTVVDVSGLSRMRTVTVEFTTGNRRESFIAAKCPLQPVGLS